MSGASIFIHLLWIVFVLPVLFAAGYYYSGRRYKDIEKKVDSRILYLESGRIFARQELEEMRIEFEEEVAQLKKQSVSMITVTGNNKK